MRSIRGPFDPIPTNGHVDLVQRTLRIFDQVIIAIAYNQDKGAALFSVEERMATVRKVFESEDARARGQLPGPAGGLRRGGVGQGGDPGAARGVGLRVRVPDGDHEPPPQPNIETFFMMTSESSFYISSRLVKEVAGLGGDVAAFVPEVVLEATPGEVSPAVIGPDPGSRSDSG